MRYYPHSVANEEYIKTIVKQYEIQGFYGDDGEHHNMYKDHSSEMNTLSSILCSDMVS